MKKITFFLFLFVTTLSIAQSLEGTWKMSPQAGAFGVGPNQGDTSWFANSAADVTTRACFFDDEYVFNADGTFANVQGAQTWLEGWQGAPDGCGTPVAPHNGSNAATYTYNSTANTITLTGVGAYLGLPKAYNGGELTNPANAPASITYTVTAISSTTMTLDISIGGGWWRFNLTKQVATPSIEGTWKMSPQAGAFGVGPNQGDTSWFSNSLADVTTRACFFDDEYVFNADGTFTNVLGSQTWIEGWQGSPDGCGTPVAPHNGSNPATYTYNSTANTITLTGVGAYLGLPKAYNGGELTNPANAPASITYTVTAISSTTMTLDISIGGGWWRFNLTKQAATSPIEGTWKMSPQAGAFGVGPNQGDTSWFSNSLADVTTRACFFDDEYVFNADGTFTNVLGSQTWIEGWQGSPDGCGTPVAPHNGSNPATYTYDSSNNTITLTGVGAYLGLPKAYNGGELTSPANAPASITYTVVSITPALLTLDISIGGGWWRFILQKLGQPTCNDGIQNGDETGVDCGGTTCPVCVTPPMVAAPTPPARPTSDVVSFYSDAYSNIAMNNFDAGWCGGAATTEVQIEGNNTLRKNTGVVCHGVDFTTNRQNLTDFTHMHFDFYIADADLVGDVFNVKLVNFNGTNAETSALEVNINGGTTPQLVANQWVSVDVPITALGGVIAGNLARNDVAQIGITTANVGSVWYDNIYVHKNTVLGVNEINKSTYTLFPNPAHNTLTITANSSIEKVKVYNILGQEVYSNIVNSDSVTLDVSSLNEGVYIIKTTINGTEASSKFVKK
jgi:hypothetical protein